MDMQAFMDDVVGIGKDVGHVKGYRGHVCVIEV
jgi:hypothetical protein